MRNSLAALPLLALMLADSAWAKPPKPSYRLPPGWNVVSEDKNGISLTDGLRSILLKPVDAKGARFWAPELYGKKDPDNATVSFSSAAVAGARVKKSIRRYERLHSGEERHNLEYVYGERFVMTGAAGQLWLIEFKSPSAAERAEPRGLDDWKAFLQSLRPR